MRRTGFAILAWIVFLGAGFSSGALLAQDMSFLEHSDFLAGDAPSSVAAGDFDLDGHTDLAVTNHESADITILLGDGTGSFTEGEPVLIGAELPAAVVPSVVKVGYFDDDERLDLVVASDVDDSVTVLLGNGDGTFQERSRIVVGKGPEGLVAIDVNGDGKLDIATADTFDETVSVALGNGDGTLRQPRAFPIGDGPWGIAAGDLTRDGRVDLAVSLIGDNVVVVMIGDGSGSFQIPCVGDCNRNGRVTIDELVKGTNIALGKVNLSDCPAFDRNDDGLVTVDEMIRGVNGALNGCTVDGFLAGPSPAALVIDDFDDDGSTDIAVANDGSDFVSVLFGDGFGMFIPQDFSVGEVTRGLATADIDGDGELDLVTANRLANSVSVLTGKGDGTFETPRAFAVNIAPSGGLTCEGIALADFNEDGRPDVVTANDGSDDVSVLLNDTEVLD